MKIYKCISLFEVLLVPVFIMDQKAELIFNVPSQAGRAFTSFNSRYSLEIYGQGL
jgi:hypothetical protein